MSCCLCFCITFFRNLDMYLLFILWKLVEHNQPLFWLALSCFFPLTPILSTLLNFLYSCYLRLESHCHQNGFDAVCKSTVNLAFLRLQPKITRIQKIQQGTKNEGKWKEARQPQTKQWLIMVNRLPEDKE